MTKEQKIIPTFEKRPNNVFRSEEKLTIGALKEQMDNGTIFKPDYQREDIAWTKSQKQLLIQSIDLNLDIPHLLLSARIDNREAIVDGQQRITAIMDYVSDKFKYKDYYFKDLPEQAKKNFWNKNIESHIYVGLTEEQEREYYLCRQNGTRHNHAEKMKASGSKVVEDSRKELEHLKFIENHLTDIKRDKNSDFYIKIYMMEQRIRNNDLDIKFNQTNIENFYYDKNNFDDGLSITYMKHIREIMEAMNYVCEKYDEQYKMGKGATIILYATLTSNYNKLYKFKKISKEQYNKLISYLKNEHNSKKLDNFIRKWQNYLKDLPSFIEDVQKIIF